MAYSTAGEKRVNYYSSPTTYYKVVKPAKLTAATTTPTQGLPTGSYMADNARTLTEVRFAAARVGDESISCPSSYNHHDTTTTTTTTAAPATTCRYYD